MDSRDDSEKEAHLERLRQALREGEESGFVENFDMGQVRSKAARMIRERRASLENGEARRVSFEEVAFRIADFSLMEELTVDPADECGSDFLSGSWIKGL